jgi:hypothetical protein
VVVPRTAGPINSCGSSALSYFSKTCEVQKEERVVVSLGNRATYIEGRSCMHDCVYTLDGVIKTSWLEAPNFQRKCSGSLGDEGLLTAAMSWTIVYSNFGAKLVKRLLRYSPCMGKAAKEGFVIIKLPWNRSNTPYPWSGLCNQVRIRLRYHSVEWLTHQFLRR